MPPTFGSWPGRGNPHSARMTDAERLQRLEERYAHLQRHSVEQDKAMLELSEEVARLKHELRLLRAQQAGATPAGETEPADERPPHY